MRTSWLCISPLLLPLKFARAIENRNWDKQWQVKQIPMIIFSRKMAACYSIIFCFLFICLATWLVLPESPDFSFEKSLKFQQKKKLSMFSIQYKLTKPWREYFRKKQSDWKMVKPLPKKKFSFMVISNIYYLGKTVLIVRSYWILTCYRDTIETTTNNYTIKTRSFMNK